MLPLDWRLRGDRWPQVRNMWREGGEGYKKLRSPNEPGFLASPEVSRCLHGLLLRQPSMRAPQGLANGPQEPHWEKCSIQTEGHSHSRYFRAKHEHLDCREDWVSIILQAEALNSG